MEKEKCETCKFWETYPDIEKEGDGVCRRRSPTQTEGSIGTEEGSEYAIWPITLSDWWCGDYEGFVDGGACKPPPIFL